MTEIDVETSDSGASTPAEGKETSGRVWNRWKVIVLVGYALVLGALLLAELGVPWIRDYRANDRVVLLLVLLFLPFLLWFAPTLIDSLLITLPGGQKIQVGLKDLQHRLEEVHVDLHEKVDAVDQRLNRKLSGRITSAEQALLPVIGGDDWSAAQRVDQGRLIIGSKEWPEQWIMGELISQRIESAIPKVEIERRFENGGTLKNFADLKHGWIDGYVEYTGTGCLLLSVDPRGESDAILEQLNHRSEPFGITWLSTLGPSPDYVIVIRRDLATEREIEDLAALSLRGRDLKLCGNIEFLSRRDAYIGLRRAYNLDFREVLACSFGDQYELLRGEEADVCLGHATDPELMDPAFLELADPKDFFPAYEAVPVFRNAVLDRYPEIRDSLESMSRIDNKRISTMVTSVKKIHDAGVPSDQAAMGEVRDLLEEIRRASGASGSS